MDARTQFLSEANQENGAAVLLVAQLGGIPDEIQCIFETALYDEAAHGLRPQGTYAVRALSVVEHRLSLGISEGARLIEGADHPLLYHTNTPRVAVHFDGRPADPNALALDISQTYISTFLNFRHLVDQVEDINRSVPLLTLLERGYGLLGIMPKPLAERMAKVLAHHKIAASLSEDTSFSATDSAGRSRLPKLLLLDDGYILALDFSFETMGRERRKP